MTDFEDRRRERSTDPLIALHHQLASASRANRLSTVVLADGCGLLLAGAGRWAACEELAALAPLFLHQDARNAGSRVSEMFEKVDVQPVAVDGQTLLLCMHWAPAKRTQGVQRAAMKQIAEGVARILKAAA